LGEGERRDRERMRENNNKKKLRLKCASKMDGDEASPRVIKWLIIIIFSYEILSFVTP
jgi:hypothetical protein